MGEGPGMEEFERWLIRLRKWAKVCWGKGRDFLAMLDYTDPTVQLKLSSHPALHSWLFPAHFIIPLHQIQ